MESQVTTRRGDFGTTVTLSGETLSKAHPILECCGRIDLLRAHTALCRLIVLDSGHPQANRAAEFLHWLLHVYFLMGSQCNDPKNVHPEYRRVDVGPEHLATLEEYQAMFEKAVQLPKEFVLSGRNIAAAQLDIACTVARDAERGVVRLKEAVPEFQAEHVLAFMNRLSDSLFILARVLDGGEHTTVDYGVFGAGST